MRFLALVVLMLLLAGCAAVTPVAPATPSATPVPTSEPVSQPASVPTVRDVRFAGNGDTFLERIDDRVTENGTPAQHTFVEVTDAKGTVWQGEALDFGTAQILLIQPVNSGGGMALEIEVVDSGDWESVLAASELGSSEEFTRPAPEIRFVRARQGSNDQWAFDVTLAYPDTGWDDYVDGWHIATPSDEILGTRILLHPHVNEQPFTRSLSNVAIPADVEEVIVRAHTLVSGYSPETVTVPLAQPAQTAQYEVVKP